MKKLLLAFLALPLLFACSPSVKRVETNLVKDVSGGWNDTDAQMVAQEMITDCLQGGRFPTPEYAERGGTGGQTDYRPVGSLLKNQIGDNNEKTVSIRFVMCAGVGFGAAGGSR